MAEEQESEYCGNCKRQIASANFIMHEMHCGRNIVLCNQCQEPVPRSEMDVHINEYHAKVPCLLCNESFEKYMLDDHMHMCPKRSLHCTYCQLDMPACDLDEHMDYCGTRTEWCKGCSQFVMHRDQNQHELSGCTYPPPKNSPVEAASPGGASSGLRSNGMDVADDFHMEHMNPFAMNELNRILHDSAVVTPVQNNTVSTVSGITSRGGAVNSSGLSRRNLIRPRPRLEINRNISRTSKNTNESAQSSRHVNAHKSQPQNQPRNWAQSRPRNDSSELEAILARHLVDDSFSDMFTDDNLGKHTPNITSTEHELRRTPPPQQEEDSDDPSLPCEFCEELFPMEFLVEHQNACNPDSASPELFMNVNNPVDLSPRLSPSDTYPEHVLPNNSSHRSMMHNSQPTEPHIVDNISMLAAHDWFSSPAAAADGMDGETMLPCEFCNQQFPDDLLVQHQAICEVDIHTPPRSRSPRLLHSRASTRSLRSRANVIGAAGVESSAGNIQSRTSYRRQEDPVFDFRHGGVDEVSVMASDFTPPRRNPIGATRGRLASTWRRGGRGMSNVNKDPKRNSMPEARTTTRGRGIIGLSNTTSRYSRHGNGVRGPPEPQTSFIATHARDASPEFRRQKKSAAPTNRTVRQVLQANDCSANELLEALDKEEKSNRNQKTKDQTSAGEQGDLSLSGAVNGDKSGRANTRMLDDIDGESRYDPSFAVPSRAAPKISSKQRPVASRTEFAGASNLRVGKPRTATNGVTSSRGAEASIRSTNAGSTARKRTNSRSRKAPQGEP